MPTTSAEIEQYVLDQIRSGKLRPGDQVPSRPQVEQRFGCARATVDKAFAQLRRSRIVRSESGRGTFVADPVSHPENRTRPFIVIPGKTRGIETNLFIFGIYRELVATLNRAHGEGQITVEEPSARTDSRLASDAAVVYWVRPSLSMVDVINELGTRNVRQVLLNRDFGDVASVCTDAAAGQRRAVHHLVDLGHRRVGYAHHPVNVAEPFSSERMLGFVEGAFEAGLDPEDAPRVEVPRKAGVDQERVLRRWLAGDHAPSAIVIPSTLAGALMRACSANGLRVPRDLSVLTIDEVHDPHSLYGHRFTCQRQRLEQIARRAASIGSLSAQGSASRTGSDGPPAFHVRYTPDLVVGDTAAAPTARRAGSKRRVS